MPTYPFAIHVHPPTGSGITILSLMESVSTESAPRLANTLMAFIPPEALDTPPRLVLNLSRCEFICSTGIGVLHYYRNRAVNQGGDLKLAEAQPFVLNILRSVLGPEYIDILPDETAAVAKFEDDADSDPKSDETAD